MRLYRRGLFVAELFQYVHDIGVQSQSGECGAGLRVFLHGTELQGFSGPAQHLQRRLW